MEKSETMNLMQFTEQYASDGRRDRFNLYLIISSAFHVIVAGIFLFIFFSSKATGNYHAAQTEELEVSLDEFFDFTVGNYKMLKSGESSVYDAVAEDGSEVQSGSHNGTGTMSVLTYNEAVKQLIERKKEYPPNAKKRRMEGEITVSFVVDCKGRLKSAEVKKSSGYSLLDSAAVATINEASPFPEFGSFIKQPELEMNVVLVYKL